jgi:hypothetical protein
LNGPQAVLVLTVQSSFHQFIFVIFSDTKKQLQQEVEERLENIALLTDADKEINLKFESHDSEIQKLTTTIEGIASAIESLKNADNVLTNSLNDNTLRFHVETKVNNVDWPQYTVITYKNKLTDTHSAMNTETGFFTAPFSGTYGFVFNARLYCDAWDRSLYVDHNDAITTIHNCHSSDSFIHISISIYFALNLKKNDRVGLFSANTLVRLDPHPAKFTGFLLQKS